MSYIFINASQLIYYLLHAARTCCKLHLPCLICQLRLILLIILFSWMICLCGTVSLVLV